MLLLAIWTFIVVMSGPPRPIGYTIYGLFILWIVLTGVGISSPALRRISLSESILRIPKGWGAVKIPVEEVAGIGLLFRYWPLGTGWNKTHSWDLTIWRTDGTYQCDFAVSVFDRHQGPSGVRLKPRMLDDAIVVTKLAGVDSATLASSRAGEVATEIYGNVRDLQGDKGPLATLELQKHASWSNQDRAPLTIAFWSPDGEMGPTHWAREREAPENPPIGWANR